MPAVAGVNQRERILDEAFRLIAEHGSASVSMRQLARSCNLQVAAIYHYFDSKDALLAAVIDERRYGARLAEVPPVDRDWSIEHRLRAVAETVWNGALEEEAVWRLLLGEGLRGEPAALPVGRDLLVAFRAGLTAWIAEVVPEVGPSDAVADLVIGQMFTGFIRTFFEPDTPTDVIGNDLASSLLTALCRKPDHEVVDFPTQSGSRSG